MAVLANAVISGVLIALASWLAGRYPRLAGFVVALPLATLLVLPMAHAQHHDAQQIQKFALSVLVAVPVVMLFLVPFIAALRYGLSFSVAYSLACFWLVPGFYLHRALVKAIG